ncbi:MAG: MmgE/PrpD family protein [Streptosporangiaceae bacterium]
MPAGAPLGARTGPTSVKGSLDELGRFVAGLSWPAQTPAVRHATQRIVWDSVAVMIAGGRLAESCRLRARLPVSDGPATVFGSARTAGVVDAAWLNGVSLVSLELDEGNKRARGHAGAHVLPAALALAEERHAGGPELAAAFLAGHEVASRFGRAVTLRPGVHPHGNWGVAGAAAAAARLGGLDAAATAAALDSAGALALATPFRVATAGMGVRNAWIGHANAAGIRAAALAQEGEPLTGVAGESLGELLGVLAVDELTAGLGAGLAVTTGYFKRHASCSYTHPPADAALAVHAARGPVDPDAVASIEVESHHLAAGLCSREWPTRLAAMFSIPYVVSVALRQGACGPDMFDEDHRHDPAVARLAAKVAVSVDPRLDGELPEHRAARLRIRWADGAETVIEVENPVGDADFHPLDDDQLMAKSAGLLGGEDQAALVRRLSAELLAADDAAPVLASLRRCGSEAGGHAG